jgi:hypothetical protein
MHVLTQRQASFNVYIVFFKHGVEICQYHYLGKLKSIFLFAKCARYEDM